MSLPFRTRGRVVTQVGISLVLSCLAIVSPGIASTIHPALCALTAKAPPDSSLLVWVFFSDRGFRSGAELDDALRVAQSGIGERALARRARAGSALADDADLPVCARYRDVVGGLGAIRHESRWLNAVSAWLTPAAIEGIAGLPFVREIRPVARGRMAGFGPERAPDGRILERPDPALPPMKAVATPDDPYGMSHDQLGEIGVIAAHGAGYSGARVLVMMLDTGFRKDHEAFAESEVLAEHDFVFSDDDTQNEPADSPYQHWHGTATWSALGGRAPGTLIGPAYRSTFVLAKTEDVRSETPVEEDNYIAALEWGDSLGVMVTSASLIYLTFDGGEGWTYPDLDGDTTPLTRALDRAAGRGILCVNAMGNYGAAPGTLGVPADADSILSCGAVDAANEIANFSSRGPTYDGRIKPEVVARGVNTFAADANGLDTYINVSGTSLSTPLIGGACALVLEAHPEWSAQEARAALMQTADRATDPDNDYGYGRIDVWAAIESAPRVVPVPFDLLAPDDGETVAVHLPTFRWEPSSDPGEEEIEYEVWIDDQEDFSSPLVYPGLQDTIFTIPDPLAPQSGFRWRVIAEEPGGYRRVSREDWYFSTREESDTQEGALGADPWHLEAAPNPWSAETCLRWYAPAAGLGREVRLSVLDAAGRRLMRERLPVTHVGWNDYPLHSRSPGGTCLTSGVYIVLLEAPGSTVRRKVVLAR